MKLAEALIRRKELQTRIKEDMEALEAAVITPQGLGPDEEPNALLRQIELTHLHLEGLVVKINQTNNQARLPEGASLMEAIAHRDVLTKRLDHLKGLLKTVLGRNRREPWQESSSIQTTHLSVESLRLQTNALAKELRELDLSIQTTNWNTDLVA